MKTHKLIASLVTALCILGCSKHGGAAGKGLVPATAAEVAANPEFKLEYTTKRGVKCYVKPITPEIAHGIDPKSRDHHFLDEHAQPFLLVPVYEDKIADTASEEPGLSREQVAELATWSQTRTSP